MTYGFYTFKDPEVCTHLNTYLTNIHTHTNTHTHTHYKVHKISKFVLIMLAVRRVFNWHDTKPAMKSLKTFIRES